MKYALIIFTGILPFSTPSAHAAVVTWNGTATITTLGLNLAGSVALGETATVGVSYNTSASPSYSTYIAGGDLSEYRAGADVTITLTIGINVWTGVQTVNPGARTASVHDNANGVVDNISFILQEGWQSVADNASVSGIGANRLRVYFSSTAAGNLFTGTALPNVEEINLGGLQQFFGYIDDANNVSTRFTGVASTVTVPEPSSFLLAGLFTSTLLLRRRRVR